ncbi:hypothetical protein OPU71_10325 [Niveibacterium sp. 24ML]|uniref:hypothetical protein n=1 Tax=Niveibacterium sp. 24ML TaxID=2985512 RepID=UPI00226ECA4F|nr:hypothetical protein [Niveibacterium sp. 24ML]MCX9156516.1 hypothetical protein [Niveibacterium sp. 24ML]
MQVPFKRVVMPTQAELLAWVRETPPAWANQTIKSWDDVFPRSGAVDVLNFVSEERWCVGDIDINAVVGQWDHYAGCTWRDAILEPKYRAGRMVNVLHMLDKNPGYYTARIGEAKEIYFSSVDGESWYSDGGGNHRTIVAKFALAFAAEKSGRPVTLTNVHLHQYEVDWHCHSLYLRLRALIEERDLGINIHFERHRLAQVEKGVERFGTVFFVTDWRHTGNALSNRALMNHLDSQEFCAYANWVLASDGVLSRQDRIKVGWQKWFGRHPNSLVFPGFRARPHTSRMQFVEELQALAGATR